MTSLTTLLDQIDRLDKDVTPGPWAVDKDNPRGIHDPLVIYPPEDDGGVIAYVQPDQDDAEFIALARTALPQLAAAVKGVLDVLDTYPAPRKEADPTGYATARLALLEHHIRKAIGDAMEADDAA